jgi:hypothetical protein
MKVALMNSLAFLTFQILKAIYTQNLVIGQELVSFQIKEIFSSHRKLFL